MNIFHVDVESGRKIVCEKIKHQREKYSWIFYFLGTNFDAIEFGKKMGFDPNTCINYGSSSTGCANVLRSTSHALNRVRYAPSVELAQYASTYTQDERVVSLQQ
jgi:hypothetical protein